jgi:hypothetical protein
MTASSGEYYGILGLTSDATLADVKKAYRKLARQHHPDRNNADPGAIDRFRRITEAYEYLSAHLKDNANGNGHSRPGPAAPPRAPPQSHIFEGGTACVDLAHGRRRSVASPPPCRVSLATG